VFNNNKIIGQMKKFLSQILLILVLIAIGGVASYAQTTHGRTAFAPFSRNINVGEQIDLKYFVGVETPCSGESCSRYGDSEQVFGQWFSLAQNVVESLGGGLFRGTSEGYGRVRVVSSDGKITGEEFIGVVDPTKPVDTSYDVRLLNRHPVYTWVDAKFSDSFGVAPFVNIDYIPGSGGGHFAVVGECADGRDAGIPPINRGHRVEFEDGGLYILKESGEFVAKGNVCKDTANIYNGCYEAGGCNVGKQISVVDEDKFILDVGAVDENRSTVLYDIGGNRVSLDNRLFFTDRNDRVDPQEEVEVISFRHVAYANGVMVGVAEETTGRPPVRIPGYPGGGQSIERKNIFYSVPEFQRLAEISVPPRSCSGSGCSGSSPLSLEVYTPMFGVGDFFVTRTANTGEYDVYRMPSRNELRDGVKPEKVQTILSGNISSFTKDATNPKRVMLVTGLSSAREYQIYEATDTGLSVIREGVLQGASFSTPHNIALTGDLLAYSTCTEASQTNPVGFGSNSYECQLVVDKGGNKLRVEPLPLNIFRSMRMHGIAISPSGHIMVAAYNYTGVQGDNGNLYLYQIGQATGQPPINPPLFPPDLPPGFPPNFGSFTPLNLDFFLGVARSYINSVVGIVGGTPIPRSQSQSSPQSSTPVPSPTPSPFPGSTGSPQSPQSSGTTLGVVKDIEAIPNVSPTAYANLIGSDKCKGLFSGKNVREMGYDGGERVLWCVEYENITYQPGSETAVILTDLQMLFPREECSTLGSRWEQVPGTEARTIGYCQRPLEISYASGASGRQEVAFMFAVPLEKSSNPLNKIKEKIENILGDILDSVDALEDIIPEHSLINRHLDVVSALLGPLANESNKGVEEIYHHDKADVLFLMVKPLYPFSSLSGSGSGNQSLCSAPLTTVANIRNFQCQTGIVCSGTETTTGYGNLGPQTQAKWQQTCGTNPLAPVPGGGSAGGSGPIVPENQQEPFDDYQGDTGGVLGVNTVESRSFWSSVSESLGRIYRAGQSLISN
jgi:hypothetical protein